LNVAWSDGRLKGYEYNSIPNPNVKSQTAKSPAPKAKKGDTPQEKGDLFTSCASEAAHFCSAGDACRAPRLPNKMSCASTLAEERSDPSEVAKCCTSCASLAAYASIQALLGAPRGNQKDVVRQHAYRGALATPAKRQTFYLVRERSRVCFNPSPAWRASRLSNKWACVSTPTEER